MSNQLNINPEIIADIKDRFALSAVKLYATLELNEKKWSLDEKRAFIKKEIAYLVKIAQEIMLIDDYIPSESTLNGLDFNQTNNGNINYILWYFRDAETLERVVYCVKLSLQILLKAVK